jgi:hypothetical protein
MNSMNKRQLLSAAVSLHILICAGCGGKKDNAAPADKTGDATSQKSVADVVAPSQSTPPPPPPIEAPAPQAAQAQPAPAQTIKPIDGSAAYETPQSWSNTQKFQRNQSWMSRLASGDPELKKKALAEIQKANLSATEMAEFRKMCQFYGVKF